ncbi:MAG: RNA 2',3'-cyclic phosphodiesterase [Acidobacteriota bacterium]|nr:MAG: RNA 2',3'-cyclic phosphodiesterase [Acidobacteriota bacterium]
MKQRLFVGVPLPPATRHALGQWTAHLAACHAGWRWVRAEQLHVTLRFLGDTDETIRPQLESGLAELAAAARRFVLPVAGWGVFPGPSRPRVLWAGVHDDDHRLGAMATSIERLAQQLGFEPERRRFSGHVTLARAARGARRAELPGTPKPEAPRFGELIVDRVVLFCSHLGLGGARYETLAAPELAAVTGETGDSR